MFAPDREQLVVGFVAMIPVAALTVGLKLQHLLSIGAVVALLLAGGRLANFAERYWPVPLTGLVYDFSRILAVQGPRVHVADLYHAELRWFGVGGPASWQTLNEWLGARATPWLDVVCGAAYLIYLYVPIGLGVALYFVDRRRMAWVVWGFFVVTLLGIVGYVVYPAAPPWYAAKYGLGPALQGVLPDPAGAARFDQLLGTGYFSGFYSQSAHVFGAVPSLHVGYVAVAYFGVVGLGRAWELPVALLTLLVAFSALYLQHHYVIDLLAGLVCALAAHGLVRAIDAWLDPRKKVCSTEGSGP